MALPAPNLDDRRFQDLVDDAMRMVRRSCPGWTDHNFSDPGVTLIETFAFMTDQLLYRLNRVPDRLQVKFLDLIGLRMLPPTPARTEVTFWLSTPARTPMVITEGTEVGTIRTRTSASIVFSTRGAVTVSPCTVRQVRTRGLGAPTSVDRTSQLGDRTPFPAFSTVPLPGDELLVGLDGPVPRCAVRLEVAADIEGLGIDPKNPPLVWEAWTGESWTACEGGEDETGGLNRSGTIVLHVPERHQFSIVDGVRAAWLRARVVEPADERRGYSASPSVTGLTGCTVGVTVDAINAELVEQEVLGSATGVAGECFSLSKRPVLSGVGGAFVEVSSPDGWERWEPVDNFAESGPHDRCFVIDGAAGEVLFGPVVRLPDGGTRQYGAVPAKGATVRIRRYATGGGVRGNVVAGAIRTLRSSVPFVAAVENRHSARGGVEAETLAEAKDRGPLLLRTRSRAVTAEDYEVLSRQAAPEAARVHCVPAGAAGVPGGMVKVLVVPAAATDRNRIEFVDLLPPEATLTRLAERLAEVRLVGTTVSVEPPTYRGVTVVAKLVARRGASAERVREDALDALYRFLSPLPGGGPAGAGWPFGRAVRTGDVHAMLQQVTGVDLVDDVRLFSANPVTGERGTEHNSVAVESNSLVFSFDHQVQVAKP